MKPEIIEAKLLVMGEPHPLILDYLDSTQSPSIDKYFEYKWQEEREHQLQARWDSKNRKDPITIGRSLDGSTITGLMANLNK